MTQSATPTREERRQLTSRRITVCAQQLADARGIDGFTMDDLAGAADVSRRTLFNYFGGKLDAVLGTMPELAPEALETFVAGGPHGVLVDDLGELAVELLSVHHLTRAELDLAQRVFLAEPRLIVLAHARFAETMAAFTQLILDREGPGFGEDRARLLVRLLISIFDCCLPVADAGGAAAPAHPDDERPLAEVYVETLSTARALLA